MNGKPQFAATAIQARPTVHALPPYDPDSPPCEFDLADNANAFGVSPAVLDALHPIAVESVSRYPSAYSTALRHAVAEYVGVSPGEVIIGCGSDDILDSAYRAFAAPGAAVALSDPTFVMAKIFAATNGLRPAPLPLAVDMDVDAQALVNENAPITYICSPNNPTGNLLSARSVDFVLEAGSGLVILDEAYAEYSGRSRAVEAASHGRLLVLRTFSKAFGLAGLRIGYGIGAPELITELEKVRGPYKVSSLGERAAVAALRAGLTWMRDRVVQTLERRGRFEESLRAAGFAPLTSDANFVLVPVADARRSAARLLQHGVAVRGFPALPRIGDALRITIGPWKALERVVHALAEAP